MYTLLDSKDKINRLMVELNIIGDVRLPFNKINLAYVRPTLDLYLPGSLAFTGLGGYFDYGDG